MKMSNVNSYPATNKFERFLIEENLMVKEGEALYWNLPLAPGEVAPGFNKVQDQGQLLHEMLGEYEHGSCDLDTVPRMLGMEAEADFIHLYYNSSYDDKDLKMEHRAATYIKKAMMALEEAYEDIILSAKAR